MRKFVGIDFGTSTTLIAKRIGESRPEIIPIGVSTPWLPSVVGIDPGNQMVVGEAATNLEANCFVRSIKTLIGQQQREIDLAGRVCDIDVLARSIIQEAMDRALEIDPHLFRDSTVFASCPALWTYESRRRLADIYCDLGISIDVADLIDEPVAAGLDWKNEEWLRTGSAPLGKSLIYDAGGGTLDVAFIEVRDREGGDFTVLAAEARQGSGDELDQKVISHLLHEFSGLEDQPAKRALLTERARELKEALSQQFERSLPLGGGFKEMLRMERWQLETLFSPLLSKSLRVAEISVRSSEIRTTPRASSTEIRQQEWGQFSSVVDNVVLVGGMSRIPLVRSQISNVFPSSMIFVSDHPQTAVALGLTYGLEIHRLNLPRPPVTFLAEWDDPVTSETKTEVLYEAFSPLYRPDQVLRGESLLGVYKSLPSPREGRNTEVRIKAVAPDRNKTPYEFNVTTDRPFRVPHISLVNSVSQRVSFKLYANGDLSLQGLRSGMIVRLSGWPKAKGPNVIDVKAPAHVTEADFHAGEQWRNH